MSTWPDNAVVYALRKQENGATAAELAAALDVPTPAVRQALKRLSEAGQVEQASGLRTWHLVASHAEG